MKKFLSNYKDTLNKVELSKNDAIRIENKIIKPSKHHFSFNYVLYVILLTLVIGTSAVLAKEITGFVLTTKTSDEVNSNNNIKITELESKENITISSTVPKNLDKNKQAFYIYEIEDMLGIKVLKNSLYNNNKFLISNIEYNNDNISYIEFITDINDENNTKFSFMMYTQFSDKKSKYSFIEVENRKLDKYYINALDTNAYIYDYDIINKDEMWNDVYPVSSKSIFINNGIVYSISMKKTNYKISDYYQILDNFTN